MASDEPIAEAPDNVSGDGQVSRAPVGAGFHELVSKIKDALAQDASLRVVAVETKDKSAPAECRFDSSRPPVTVGKKNGYTTLRGDFVEVSL